MNKITLKNVLPNVFAQLNDINSEVWQQDVQFVKGTKYLVEANSGTGKSSLCSFIYGYRNDYSGNIYFDEKDIRTFSIKDWVGVRNTGLSLLWQELRLFPELTAMENVEIKNRLTGFQEKQRIVEWFEMLGVSEKMNTPVGKMSYGQQQRIAMMRTLCQPFDFVFVDEPISHLDDVNSGIMGQILTDEAERQGAGLIVTSIGKRMPIEYDKIYKL
jgi:ABC-type lipoprotein export system ATPase subunit